MPLGAAPSVREDVPVADEPVEPVGDEWAEAMVVAHFSVPQELDAGDLLDAMWPVEERAMIAIEESGLGYIDGNGIGAGEYDLYFYGADHEAVWELLEPILREAPLPLRSVTLRPAGDPVEQTVLLDG